MENRLDGEKVGRNSGTSVFTGPHVVCAASAPLSSLEEEECSSFVITQFIVPKNHITSAGTGIPPNRKPTQTWGEHATSPQKCPLSGPVLHHAAHMCLQETHSNSICICIRPIVTCHLVLVSSPLTLKGNI